MAVFRSEAGRIRSQRDMNRTRVFLDNYRYWRRSQWPRRKAATFAMRLARPAWMDHFCVQDFAVGIMGGAVVAAFAALFWFISLVAAWPADVGQFDNVNPSVRSWFKGVKSPKGLPCCDIADGHRTEFEIRGTSYWVPIDGRWTEVPQEAVVYDAGNPTGDAVVWYTTFALQAGATIRCFVPGGGV